ncbi:hypothetical protein Acr_29g0009880 [Actinidia rufa]|uniref:Uncharacterized protein n=1 Tax=Actinidia rufa TaxID=165716 RepID=A0A7J0HFC0_9ERIC|nr:hypothetical protein Acr_29g0009880 [Actinidia rufa]
MGLFYTRKGKNPSLFLSILCARSTLPQDGSKRTVPIVGPPAKAKVEIIDVPLDKIGEHGDWEHVKLRISNFNGKLKTVYFSQHSGRTWVSTSGLEFMGGNKAVTYSSLHSHALFPKSGLVLEGNSGIGIRMDTARACKGQTVNTRERFLVVVSEFLGISGG